MPTIKIEGLKGLPGLNRLSEDEKRAFYDANKDVLNIRNFGRYRDMEKAAEIMYNNQQYIKRFGRKAFDLSGNTAADYNFRNNLLKDSVVNEAWTSYLSPFKLDGTRDNNLGLGADWEKYNEMSTDGKLKLLESGWQNNQEFEDRWKKTEDDVKKSYNVKTGNRILDAAIQMAPGIDPYTLETNSKEAVEATKEFSKERNQRILDHIYNDDLKARTRSNEVRQAVSNIYDSDPEVAGLSDDEVIAKFNEDYGEDGIMTKLGAGEYGSHLGSSEMKDFSVDDMRKVLAKQKAYMQYMGPQAAATAINNEAKEYIKDHQGTLKRLGLFGKDVLISSASYTADKVNGLVNTGYGIADMNDGGVEVYVDNQTGQIIDSSRNTPVRQDRTGKLFYRDGEGNAHLVHLAKMKRTAIRNMGKNLDGSNNDGILNPQWWSRAEQFGTLDEAEQQKYEKFGASPYKVAYDPNEDTDLWYEAFKMMSFGIADAASQFLPYGIGLAGKGIGTINKLGKAGQVLGKTMQGIGHYMTAESRIGQIGQGSMGALGIAYAYNRGAFQEELVKNMANAEATNREKSTSEVEQRYKNDERYRQHVDAAIANRAAEIVNNEVAQMDAEARSHINVEALTNAAKEQAQKEVMEGLVDSQSRLNKNTKEYAALTDEAINSAGNAAFLTFAPEAVKYGLVNTLGFRKFLYTNPAGLQKKVSKGLQGLKEFTRADGKQRLEVASKFLTKKDKWKQLGKFAGSQAWGGAWTNGTDDMMTDAAERINNDSYDRYLNGYLNGQAVADTYGFADGFYSYMMGLSNSLGQETTWNAAEVGALGSLISGSLNFVNIARLASKEGRQAFKDAYLKEYQTDEQGNIQRDEQGQSIVVSGKKGRNALRNAGGIASYFIQNGVLNNYYGAKQNERQLQDHAYYVNSLLDDYNDFKDIEDLMATDNALDDAADRGDEKTMRFIKAMKGINALRSLTNNSKDLAKMSSVVDRAQSLVDKFSEMEFTDKDNIPEDEDVIEAIEAFNSQNKNLPQGQDTDRYALKSIIKNAKDMKEAADAYGAAEVEVIKAEQNAGKQFDPAVRQKLILNHALNSHWEKRLSEMKDEVGDTSEAEELSDEDLLASIGGRKNAQDLVSTYNRQEKEINKEVEEQQKKTEKAQKEYDEAIKALNDNTDDTKKYDLQKKAAQAEAKLGASKLQESYLREQVAITQRKRAKVEKAFSSTGKSMDEVRQLNADVAEIDKQITTLETQKKGWTDADGKVRKGHNKQVKNANKAIENLKAQREAKINEIGEEKNKVLTADEIMSLDPVARARMMNKNNRSQYSKEQQSEIEKLEKQLSIKDTDALQKIQDIATLTQRIETNKDSYNKVLQNPEAAAWQFEAERAEAAREGYGLIDTKNANILVNAVRQMIDSVIGNETDMPQAIKNLVAYMTLRRNGNNRLLDIIDKDNLLPEYKQQLDDAKKWHEVTDDLYAVIEMADRPDDWKKQTRSNVENIVESSKNRDEILKNLRQVRDNTDDQILKNDFDYILQGMESLGHQKNATTTETKEKKKDREEAARDKIEEKKKETEDAAKAVAARAAEEEEKKKGAEKHPINKGGSDVWSTDKDDLEQKGKLEEVELGENNPSSLMAEGEEPATMDAGEMLYKDGDTVKKGQLKVTITKSLHGDTISFTIDGKKQTITINPEGWTFTKDGTGLSEEEGKKLGITKEDEFQAEGLWHINGHWYFQGGFLGKKEGTHVRVSDDFDMDKAVEEEKKRREGEYGERREGERSDGVKESGVRSDEVRSDGVKESGAKESGVEESGVRSNGVEENSSSNLIVEDGVVKGKSKTVEEQAEEMGKSDSTGDMKETTDPEVANTSGEEQIEMKANTLSGNAMAEWESVALRRNGKLQHKKGASETDSMNRFFNWMKNAGHHVQDIIDNELGQILKENPHAKVKFMVVKSDYKENADGVKDADMKTHLMLVLDYDDGVNKGITKIHNEERYGGVIETNGKKYLIIGVAGYGRSKDKRDLYDILYGNNPKGKTGYGLIRRGMGKFFEAHPEERFYVDDNIETEIVPMSLIPGYIVKQLESDDHAEYRPITELLKDKERNPQGKTLETLSWGIQEETKFLIVSPDGSVGVQDVMLPRDKSGNTGTAFVLVPASNGKMVPSYLKPLKWNETKDGKLKDRVMQLLTDVTAPNHNKRLQAIIGLYNIFYFNPEGDTILTTNKEDRNVVSLVHDGQVFATFNLDSTFNRQAFLEAFAEMNPRVNITGRVLQSKELLEQYAEAGALDTDLARLTTAGSAYSIYGVDSEGKMLTPTTSDNSNHRPASSSDFKNGDKQQVIYKGRYYTYADGNYSFNGETITDGETIKQLDYNRRIIENGLLPTGQSKTAWDTYIMTTGDNPEVIRVNRNTKEVKELSEEEGKELLDKIKEERLMEDRKKAAEEAWKNGEMKLEDVPMEVDEETGEVEVRSRGEEEKGERSNGEDGLNRHIRPNGLNRPNGHDRQIRPNMQSNPSGQDDKKAVQSFGDMVKEKKNKLRVMKMVMEKQKKGEWKDAPRDVKKMEDYMRKKNINVDAIGTSEADIEAWMKTVEECR